MIFKGGKGKI